MYKNVETLLKHIYFNILSYQHNPHINIVDITMVLFSY